MGTTFYKTDTVQASRTETGQILITELVDGEVYSTILLTKNDLSIIHDSFLLLDKEKMTREEVQFWNDQAALEG